MLTAAAEQNSLHRTLNHEGGLTLLAADGYLLVLVEPPLLLCCLLDKPHTALNCFKLFLRLGREDLRVDPDRRSPD